MKWALKTPGGQVIDERSSRNVGAVLQDWRKPAERQVLVVVHFTRRSLGRSAPAGATVAGAFLGRGGRLRGLTVPSSTASRKHSTQHAVIPPGEIHKGRTLRIRDNAQ